MTARSLFTLTTAWRATFNGPNYVFQYGDGNTLKIYAFDTSSSSVSTTDIYLDSLWRMTRTVLTYTYASSRSNTFVEVGFGPQANRVTVRNQDCQDRSCDVPFRVFTGFVITGGASAPSISVPAIVQVPIDAAWSMYLLALSSDGSARAPCSEVLGTDSAIIIRPKVGTSGDDIATNSDPCQLTWNTAGATENHLYAYQIRYQIPGEQNYLSADFMLLMVKDPPTCYFVDPSYTGEFITFVGGALSVDVNVNDPNGLDVELSTLPGTLHPGMGFSPSAGVYRAVPLTYTFSYNAPAGDLGLSYSFNAFFTNTANTNCAMAFNIGVREAPPSPPPLPPPR